MENSKNLSQADSKAEDSHAGTKSYEILNKQSHS